MNFKNIQAHLTSLGFQSHQASHTLTFQGGDKSAKVTNVSITENFEISLDNPQMIQLAKKTSTLSRCERFQRWFLLLFTSPKLGKRVTNWANNSLASLGKSLILKHFPKNSEAQPLQGSYKKTLNLDTKQVESITVKIVKYSGITK